MATYGYARISTARQNIDRQIRNILQYDPSAEIYKETYTGTKFCGREQLNRLLAKVKKGDTIVFDSVSRMSRDADEGFQLYEELFHRGVNLIFLKERHIDTETYKKAINSQLEMTGDIVDYILDGINQYLLALAKEQIRLAFAQSEKEVHDLRQRTKEGIETAKKNGKQIGRKPGTKYNTKKGEAVKKAIRQHNRAYGGSLTDEQTMEIAHCSKQTYYKYKRELMKENTENMDDSKESHHTKKVRL